MGKVNRYSIGIKAGVETRSFKRYSTSEIKRLIAKYNDDAKNKYFLGNLVFHYSEGYAEFTKYLKVTMPSTLEEIDKFTTRFNNDFELKTNYDVDLRNNHKLVIMYRAKKDIRTLPIYYKKDKDLLNRGMLEKTLRESARDIKYIDSLIKSKELMSSSRDSIDEYDLLRCLRDSLKYNNPVLVSVSPLINFYHKFINEKGKFNYFNFRLMATTLKNYLNIPEPVNEEIYGQTMFKDIALEELKSIYEDMQIALMDGSYNELYSKGLKRK